MTDEDDTNKRLAERAFQTVVDDAERAIRKHERARQYSAELASLAIADLRDALAACADRPSQMATVRRFKETYK